MEQRVLILCDPEEDYAQRMSDYMRREKFFPWTVKVYTRATELQENVRLKQKDMLVISESVFEEGMQKLGAGKTIILNETGIVKGQKLNNVNKYQEAEKVIQELLELGDVEGQALQDGIGAKIIGLYSPIGRCLQTSFGLCLGKILARKGKTLYLGMESYCGVEGMQSENGVDLSSLLYLMQDEENFAINARRQIYSDDKLDYIPAMVNGRNLIMVEPEEWKKLLYHMQFTLGYEYIIMDLSENVQGLFELLRMCVRVYSLAKDDPIAKRKMDQYGQLLSAMEYEDVKKKMCICKLPIFRNIPSSMAAASKGDLADYVRKLVEREEWY